MDNLLNYQEVDIGQVQVGMMKLKQDFQNDMIRESYEHLMDMGTQSYFALFAGLLHEFHNFFPTMIFLWVIVEKNYMIFETFVDMMRPLCFQIVFGLLSLL